LKTRTTDNKLSESTTGPSEIIIGQPKSSEVKVNMLFILYITKENCENCVPGTLDQDYANSLDLHHQSTSPAATILCQTTFTKKKQTAQNESRFIHTTCARAQRTQCNSLQSFFKR